MLCIKSCSKQEFLVYKTEKYRPYAKWLKVMILKNNKIQLLRRKERHESKLFLTRKYSHKKLEWLK